MAGRGGIGGRRGPAKSHRRGRGGARRRPLGWQEVRKIARTLPGVEEGSSYGTPAFRVRGKFLTRLRTEDDSLVFKVASMDERDFLLEADPAVFFITEHYRDYPAVLLRLATASPGLVRQFLEESWRRAAPRKLIAEFDAG